MIKATPAQDKLFRISVENFVKAKSRHHQMVADFTESVLARNKPEDLPDLTLRTRIMNFIWNHNYNCRCREIREGCN